MYQLTLKRCLMLSLVISYLLFPFKSSSQWVEQNSTSSFYLSAVHFLNENTGLIGSAAPLPINNNFVGGEIIRTTNGGVNWQRVLLDSNLRVKNFYFMDQNTGFAIGGSYASSGKLLKTTNSGLNWSVIIDFNTPGFTHFYNIYFANTLTGYLSSYNGIFRTINGGNNWNLLFFVADGPSEYLSYKKIHFFDVNTGIFLSDSGKIYKTSNAGINWQIFYVNSLTTFRDITFINNLTGYAIGLHGKVIRTTDQGTNWQEINFGTGEDLYSIKFTNILTGYLAKDKGVLKSTDGGISWGEVLQQNNDSIYALSFLNNDLGFVTGTKGKVFKTTTGGVIGINQISGEVPTEFLLQQNYPNPFNPNTKIKFAIPKLANVRLAVYDLLGREVESLVNQQLTPGTYEVNWNAAKFSSGIYMYRLVTNDFSMVKKMSLIK